MGKQIGSLNCQTVADVPYVTLQFLSLAVEVGQWWNNFDHSLACHRVSHASVFSL